MKTFVIKVSMVDVIIGKMLLHEIGFDDKSWVKAMSFFKPTEDDNIAYKSIRTSHILLLD